MLAKPSHDGCKSSLWFTSLTVCLDSIHKGKKRKSTEGEVKEGIADILFSFG